MRIACCFFQDGRSRRGDAGNVPLQIAFVFLIAVLLFRTEIANLVTVATRAAIAAQHPAQAVAAIAPPALRPRPETEPMTANPTVANPPTTYPPVAYPPAAYPPGGDPAREGRAAPAQMPVVVTPSLENSRNVAIARRARNGHFMFEAAVNSASLQMIVDTGATMVTLRAEDAERAGIDPESLNYTVRLRTANGSTEAAPVIIRTLTVGTITRHNVSGWVARPGRLDVNLLGQSFLMRVASFDVEGDQLVLRGGEWQENH